jgi:hypothetical protein
MKKMRSLCLTALLTLTFALSVSAGEIECGVDDPPPPAQPTAQGQPTAANGDISCGLTEAVLSALEGVLTVF